jgi:hypothetical protein
MAILGFVRAESCPLKTKVTLAIVFEFFRQALKVEKFL